MDNCCNPIQYYSTLFFFSFLSPLTFTLSTSPLFVSNPLRSFYRQIQEKNLSMESILLFYIYILDRFNFKSIAYLDQSKLLRSPPVIFFERLAKRVSILIRTIMLRDWILARQFSRRLRFNPADVSTCIILRYYITSFRLRDADISRHGCTFQFVRQIRSFRLNRGI